ncbi:MAG: undecaprenyl-phosphate glucose phosphotransferase [Burkholderiaceae bacterium]
MLNPTPLRLSSPGLSYVAWALDIGILSVVAWLVFNLHPESPTGLQILSLQSLPLTYAAVLASASLGLGLFSDSLYRSWRVNDLSSMLKSVATVWGSVIVLLMLGLFITKTSADISRVWFTVWALSCWVALSLQRLAAYRFLRWLRQRGYNFKTVLLVGKGPVGDQVVKAIHESAWSGLRIQAHIQPEQLHTYTALPEAQQPDEIWLCLPLSDEAGIRTSLEALRHSVANIRLVPDWFSIKLINHGISEALGIPMLDLSASPVTGTTRIIKAIEDRVLAFIILILISPLMLAIAIAVKATSPGPVYFRQKRNGWNGSVIKVYKFRSMYMHQEDDGQVTQATQGDPRITPLGRFLRRTSLDELPQFINVLQGRMSIVGPRPHAVAHNEYYKQHLPRYMLRHKVKPGITGWAQVHGLRGETDTLEKMEKRVEYDLYYIEHMSLWLDLKIMVMTVFNGFAHRNAY